MLSPVRRRWPDTADPGDPPRRTLPRDRFAADRYGLLTGEADGEVAGPLLCGSLGMLAAEAQPAVMYTLVEARAVCCSVHPVAPHT